MCDYSPSQIHFSCFEPVRNSSWIELFVSVIQSLTKKSKWLVNWEMSYVQISFHEICVPDAFHSPEYSKSSTQISRYFESEANQCVVCQADYTIHLVIKFHCYGWWFLEVSSPIWDDVNRSIKMVMDHYIKRKFPVCWWPSNTRFQDIYRHTDDQSP